MSDTFEELRIIARDYAGFAKHDRDILIAAADEMEHVYRQLIAVQSALIDSQGHRIALNERLLEIKRERYGLQ